MYNERLLVEWLLSGSSGDGGGSGGAAAGGSEGLLLRAAPRQLTNATGWCGDAPGTSGGLKMEWLGEQARLVRGHGKTTLSKLLQSDAADLGAFNARSAPAGWHRHVACKL